jgi:hypothetical protein
MDVNLREECTRVKEGLNITNSDTCFERGHFHFTVLKDGKYYHGRVVFEDRDAMEDHITEPTYVEMKLNAT